MLKIEMAREQHKRGLQLISAAKLNTQLHGAWRMRLGINIGQVLLPERILSEHILLTGSTGSGKTTILRHLLRQLRERKDIVILFDPDSELIQEFLEPAEDHVLNPLDTRASYWDLWSEFREGSVDADIESFANSIERGTPGDLKQKFFVESARNVIATILQRLTAQGNRT